MKQIPNRTSRPLLRLMPFLASFGLLAGCSSSSLTPDPVPQATGDPTYTLTTSFQGDVRALSATDVFTSSTATDGVEMAILSLANADGSARQQWLFTPDGSGTYSITNALIGNTFAIDVINDGVLDKVHLVGAGNFSGQQWSVTPLTNGYCRLTNNFTSAEIALDVSSAGDQSELRLSAVGNFTGQFWKITPANNPNAAMDPILNVCTGVPAE